MTNVTQLRSGATFLEEGDPWVVIKYEHIKLGRGTANIKVKIRNLKTDVLRERVFISGASVEEVSTFKRKLQFLYRDQQVFYFMDPKTFEQFEILEESLETQVPFLTEGTFFDLLFWEQSSFRGQTPLSLELPPKMKFKISSTSPGVKGNSAANVYKDATLENGLKIKVPLFIKEGEMVIVDTRDHGYVERART